MLLRTSQPSVLRLISTMSCPIATGTNPPLKWDAATLSEKVKFVNACSAKPRQLNVVRSILGECLCEPFQRGDNKGLSPSSQFVELHGIQYIGLGAVVDELTPKERVYDTLEQLTTRTERLITIGYLVDEEIDGRPTGNKIPETIPLDIWRSTYPNDKNMLRSVKRVISNIKVRCFFFASMATLIDEDVE